uniref:Uncharacterized protein n=1 Tax=Rhizophora mucronata TaxID=61149 RepID=A0A2P2NJZ3_RHIMU
MTLQQKAQVSLKFLDHRAVNQCKHFL